MVLGGVSCHAIPSGKVNGLGGPTKEKTVNVHRLALVPCRYRFRNSGIRGIELGWSADQTEGG